MKNNLSFYINRINLFNKKQSGEKENIECFSNYNGKNLLANRLF